MESSAPWFHAVRETGFGVVTGNVAEDAFEQVPKVSWEAAFEPETWEVAAGVEVVAFAGEGMEAAQSTAEV